MQFRVLIRRWTGTPMKGSSYIRRSPPKLGRKHSYINQLEQLLLERAITEPTCSQRAEKNSKKQYMCDVKRVPW